MGRWYKGGILYGAVVQGIRFTKGSVQEDGVHDGGGKRRQCTGRQCSGTGNGKVGSHSFLKNSLYLFI